MQTHQPPGSAAPGTRPISGAGNRSSHRAGPLPRGIVPALKGNYLNNSCPNRAETGARRSGASGLEGDTDTEATEIELARQTIATVLYGNVGMLMHIYRETPAQVAGFFDLDTLRRPASTPDAAPPPPPNP